MSSGYVVYLLLNLMLHSVCPCFFEQAQKNVVLEERVQVLQQQNEDLKARIDNNVAMSRCVSNISCLSLFTLFSEESKQNTKISRS